MKIRQGFVSNSSSSSFIVHGDIGLVAENMLETVIDDFSDWDSTGRISKRDKLLYDKWRKNLKKGLAKKKVQNGTIGITFPSCNYDTYIVQVGDSCYVKTCHNHVWNNNENLDMTEQVTEDSQDTIDELVDSKFVYNIRNGLIHSQLEYDCDENFICSSCKEHPWSYVLNSKGEKICGRCYEGKMGMSDKFLAEQKFKKILKNQPKFPTPFNNLTLD